MSPSQRIQIVIELRDRRHRDAVSKDLRELVELLNANKVEYLVVVAFAPAFHGVPRYTAGCGCSLICLKRTRRVRQPWLVREFG